VEPCAEGDSEPKQLLVVDDEPLVRKMLIRLLVGRGFVVLAADNGSAALTLVERGCPARRGIWSGEDLQRLLMIAVSSSGSAPPRCSAHA